VNGLAGVLQTLHHGRIAFAFIVNDTRANADVVYDEEDRALDALTAF
jgi:D-alanyl-D-alanine carboxypeptidase